MKHQQFLAVSLPATRASCFSEKRIIAVRFVVYRLRVVDRFAGGGSENGMLRCLLIVISKKEHQECAEQHSP
jgi:hypothetical protein